MRLKNYTSYKMILALALLIFSNESLLSQKDTESPERLRNYVKYLASDELEGRAPGTDGIEKAAQFIKNHFEKYPLEKFGNSYFQDLPVTIGMKLGTENKLSANVLVERPGVPVENWKAASRSFESAQDWFPMIFSENGQASGELVFVGYGISAESLKYDDYADIDVKDKICIILGGSPEGESEKSRFSNFLSLRHKAVNARNKGAKAVIFVNPQGDSADVISDIKYEMLTRNSGILALQIKRSVIARLFPKNNQLNSVEIKINKSKKPFSFAIPHTTIDLTIDLAENTHITKNVIAYSKGKSKPDEYIVIGAHYDHLGWGQVGNTAYSGSKPMIHNGADDNASGTAALMELATRFALNPAERSIIFIAFTAEEMGLLGSAHYVDNSLVPNDKKIMMINLDMIGRMKDNKVQVFGLGSSDGFASIADSLAILDSIGIVKLQDGFGPSDHSSFYRHKIPVMHFFTGIHLDYHKPSDDWEKLDYEGIAKVVDYVERISRHFASSSSKPLFAEVKETPTQSSGRGHGSSGAWFGIVPNFEESPLGCKISGASPGSPAQIAGLKENDIITHINEKEVKNLHDFMYLVGEYKPGDKLKVKLLRNGKEMTVDVVLAQKRKN